MSSYKDVKNALERTKTEQLLRDVLPSFCRFYHDGRILRLSAKTQYSYACIMQTFLNYLRDNNPHFYNISVRNISLDDIALLTKEDYLEFASWIMNRYAVLNEAVQKSSAATADHYLACLSSYLTYFCRNGMLQKNPLLGVDRVKKREKPIVYLRDDERRSFVDSVCTGKGLSERQKSAWEKTNLRETSIVIVLLDTGVRVSELVGLDVDDVDLDHYLLKVTRKGGKIDNVYYSDATADMLTEYLAYREKELVKDKKERALFLVSLGKYAGTRLSVRSVQTIVKKYACAACITDWKKITPHKLRSTYAMTMLHATGNQMIVKEQLGHEHIGTTSLYSRATESDKIKSRNAISPLWE